MIMTMTKEAETKDERVAAADKCVCVSELKKNKQKKMFIRLNLFSTLLLHTQQQQQQQQQQTRKHSLRRPHSLPMSQTHEQERLLLYFLHMYPFPSTQYHIPQQQ